MILMIHCFVSFMRLNIIMRKNEEISMLIFLSESFVSDFLFAYTSSRQTSRLSLVENGGSMWCPFQEWNQIIVVCIDRQEFYLDIGRDQLHLWWSVRHFIANTSCIGVSLPFETICCLFRILIIPNYHLWISSSTDS